MPYFWGKGKMKKHNTLEKSRIDSIREACYASAFILG